MHYAQERRCLNWLKNQTMKLTSATRTHVQMVPTRPTTKIKGTEGSRFRKMSKIRNLKNDFQGALCPFFVALWLREMTRFILQPLKAGLQGMVFLFACFSAQIAASSRTVIISRFASQLMVTKLP